MKMRRSKARKKKNRSRQRGPKYWAAVTTMGALAACTGFGCKAAPPAYGRAVSGRLSAIYLQHQAGARRFDIPPGPLTMVLDAYRNVTGLQVLVSNNEIGNIPSPGVLGVHTPEQALKQLPTGTGVTYRFTGPELVLLEVSGPATSVDVVGQASAISSPKYTEPLRNVPQTITVIPRSVIEEQGAITLRDVLRNVPGLTIAAGEGGAPAGDNLTLRGFSARNDVFIDGVRDLSPQARDPFNLEQVEVVKGPASAYNGRGSTGGTINLVSKAPTINPLYGFTFNLGTDRTKRFTGDINAPLERLGLGKRTSFRLAVLAHESEVAGRDVVENQRWGVAPSLAFGLSTLTRLTLSYFKLKQDNISDYGIPWVPATNRALAAFRDKPAPVPRETFYGLKSRDFEKLGSDLATIKFERDFGDSLTPRNQSRYGRSTRDSIATPPRFASDDSTAINRYREGQSFGTHVDNAIRQVTGTPHRVRTDLSATLFLSPPDEYDGGDLQIEDTYGLHSIKLPAGHLLLYPSTSLHCVRPVTRGERIASFFWIQSMVRDDGQRALLFDLDMAIQRIDQDVPDHSSTVQLTGVYHNLLRRWADV